MSNGVFVSRAYQASYDTTQIHPIRIQPETAGLSVTINGAAVVNTGSTSAVNNPISAVVSRGRRSKGLNARLIRVKFVQGEEPEGYTPNSAIALPALNPALMNAVEGATGTYLGGTVVVVGTSPEKRR